MKATKLLGRPILLLALLAIGMLLILHIGRSLNLPKPEPKLEPDSPPAKTEIRIAPVEKPSVKAEPPAAKPEVPAGLRVGIIRTPRGQFIAGKPVLFNSELATLRESSIRKLNRIAEFLMQNPGIKLEIIGHAEGLGSEPVNQQVSAERAALVREYLISRGIDPSRLESKGKGSLDPIESNDTQLGRQAAPWIEFLVRQSALPAPLRE